MNLRNDAWFPIATANLIPAITVLVLGLITLACAQTDRFEQSVFERLTAHSWCNQSEVARDTSGLAPTFHRYEFRSDGSFEWDQQSDYPEASGKGRWNFTARSGTEGAIRLDTGDSIAFRLHDDGTVNLGVIELETCTPLDGAGKGSAEALPKVDLSDLYRELTSNAWYKMNSFNLDREPTKVTFNTDGTFYAEYNNGECEVAGTWSLRARQLSWTPFGLCRNGAFKASSSGGSPVEVRAGLLVTDQDVRAPVALGNRGREEVDLGPLRLTYQYDEPLLPNRSNRFDFHLEYPLPSGRARSQAMPITVQGVRITMQPLRQTPEAYTATADPVEVKVLTFSDGIVTPGSTYDFYTLVMPGGTGPVSMRIELLLIEGSQSTSRDARALINLQP